MTGYLLYFCGDLVSTMQVTLCPGSNTTQGKQKMQLPYKPQYSIYKDSPHIGLYLNGNF